MRNVYAPVTPPWPRIPIVSADSFPPMTMRNCPRCHAPAGRVAFPLWLRPLRMLFPRLKRLRCHGCGWRGIRG